MPKNRLNKISNGVNKLVWSFLVCLIWMIGLAADEPIAQIEVIDINNNVLTGSDITINEKGRCILNSEGRETDLACSNIIEIIFNNQLIKAKGVWEVTLNNNDLIYGEIIESAKDGFHFESTTLGKIALRFDYLLKMRLIADPTTAWKEIPDAKEEDVVYLINGDRDKGVIKEVTRDTIKFQSSVYGRDRNYKSEEIAGIALAQIKPLPEPPEGLLVTIIGTDRSRFTGLIKKIENSVVHFHSNYFGIHPRLVPTGTVASPRLGRDSAVASQLPLAKIVQVYFKTEQNVYLSDLEPTIVKEYPTIYDPKHIVFPWNYQKDKNVTSGELISFKGRKFYKGLGVHANCELTYQLDKQYRKFFAVVGLDDEAGPKASVEFLVFLDGKKTYESGLIKWGDDPKQVNLSVARAKEMRLVVTDGGDMHILDRAAWANARLIK